MGQAAAEASRLDHVWNFKLATPQIAVDHAPRRAVGISVFFLIPVFKFVRCRGSRT